MNSDRWLKYSKGQCIKEGMLINCLPMYASHVSLMLREDMLNKFNSCETPKRNNKKIPPDEKHVHCVI